MSKLIHSWGLTLFLIVLSLTMYSQNNVWRGFVSYANGGIEPSEAICDFVKEGQMRIAPNLSDQSDYISNFTYLDTICLSSNFSLELRVKNNNTLGGIPDHDAQINLYSNGLRTSVILTNAISSQSNTQIRIGDSILTTNNIKLVTNLSDWRVVKLRFVNKVFYLYIDGIEVYKSAYTKTICNLDILKLAFKGGGAIDWIKIYDNHDTVFWEENFNDCKTLTRGIICDPFRLDKSITISRPCENDTLTLAANFPAMSYRWSTPDAKIDTNKVFKVVKPMSGNYDLTANVNTCFVFYKPINVSLQQSTTYNQTVRLCQGKDYMLSSGKVVNTEGVYTDSLKTKTGCDSIVITNLIYETPNIINMTISICSNNYTLPSGRIVNSAGLYRDTTKEVSGCLQVYDVKLNLGSTISTTLLISICEGESHKLPKGQIVTMAGTYKDTLTSIGGCDSIIISQVSVVKKPIVKIDINRTDELFEGENIIIKNSLSNNGGNYTWLENNTPLNQSTSSITVPVKGGETIYKVIVNNLGCSSVDSIKVIGLAEIKLPNAFTPNNDNINDVFSIVTKNENLYKIIQFDVYNRMGKKVYANNNGFKGWDGTYNNQELVSDTYIYMILLQSSGGKTFKYSGEVLLLR